MYQLNDSLDSNPRTETRFPPKYPHDYESNSTESADSKYQILEYSNFDSIGGWRSVHFVLGMRRLTKFNKMQKNAVALHRMIEDTDEIHH